MMKSDTMTSSKPYLVRAFYNWIIDNQLTPYIVVDADVPYVDVPREFVQEGKIILNISPMAVTDCVISNDAIEFGARFSGEHYGVYIPIHAILAIYAQENGRGMVFNEDEEWEGGTTGEGTPPPRPPRRKGKPHLKVVK